MFRRCLISVLVVAAPALAHAANAAPEPAGRSAAVANTASAGAATEDGFELIPPAKDARGGHFVVGAGPSVALPFGELDRNLDFTDFAEPGLGVAGDIGFGISRSVVVGAAGDYLQLGCSGCEATSFGVSLFARYHLVQGVRFDPWMSVGAGYRRLEAETEGGAEEYSGVEWLKLGVGGDWYPLSQLGFGPFAELNLGTFLDPPSGEDVSVYGTALFGLRLTLDAQGK